LVKNAAAATRDEIQGPQTVSAAPGIVILVYAALVSGTAVVRLFFLALLALLGFLGFLAAFALFSPALFACFLAGLFLGLGFASLFLACGLLRSLLSCLLFGLRLGLGFVFGRAGGRSARGSTESGAGSAMGLGAYGFFFLCVVVHFCGSTTIAGDITVIIFHVVVVPRVEGLIVKAHISSQKLEPTVHSTATCRIITGADYSNTHEADANFPRTQVCNLCGE